jgi:hypothetical protein
VEVAERLGEFAGQPTVKTIEPSSVRETAGGLENLFQVLPLLPGVAATDDEQGKLAVRGAGPEHNMILFDGVQVHSPQRFGDFTSSFINPATAEHVALDASGLDARHGGRLSSVTVLETRDGRTDRRLAVSGSVGLTNGDILAEGRVPGTRSGSWWATLRGTYYRFAADRLCNEEIPHFTDLQFKVTLHPTAHTRLSLVGLAGREGTQRPLLTEEPVSQIEGKIQREFDADNHLAAANLWWTPSRRLTTITTVTAYANDSRYQDHWKFGNASSVDTGPVGPFDRHVKIVDLAARQRAVVAWSPLHQLDAGVEVRRLHSSWAMSGATYAPWTSSVGPNTWGELIDYADAGPLDVRLARTQVGAWAQERIPVGAGVELEPGLRVDWNSFTGEQAVQARLRVTKRFGDTVVWSGLAWQAQTPGLETMQQGIRFYDFTSPAAADLRNERSRQIVFGVEQPLAQGASLRVETYHRTLDRLLVQRPETEEERQRRLSAYAIPPDMPADDVLLEYRPTVDPQSSGTGRASGLEVLLGRDRGRLAGWIAYTLSKSDQDLFGRTVPFDFDRRHAISAALQLRLTERVRLGVTSQYGSGFPATPVHGEVLFFRRLLLPDRTPDPLLRPSRHADGRLVVNDVGYPLRVSELNTERTRAYARTDARVTYTMRRHWEFYAEALNLLNRENFAQLVTFDRGISTERSIYEGHPFLLAYGIRATF